MAAVIAVCGSCSRQYACKKVITPIGQIITTTFFFFLFSFSNTLQCQSQVALKNQIMQQQMKKR